MKLFFSVMTFAILYSAPTFALSDCTTEKLVDQEKVQSVVDACTSQNFGEHCFVKSTQYSLKASDGKSKYILDLADPDGDTIEQYVLYTESASCTIVGEMVKI